MRSLLLLPLVLMLAACGNEDSAESEKVARIPVVVFAHGDESQGLAEQLAGFSEETGYPLEFIYGESAALTDDVIADRGTRKADVLLTAGVADIWRAADEGALRPIQSKALAEVQIEGKDPDGLWIAYASYSAVLGHAERIESRLTSYTGLSRPDLRGEVCLTVSAHPVNRAVIARLIDEKGVKMAERIVRAWVRNLKRPPFETEAELIAALADGTCGYGLLSSTTEAPGVWISQPVFRYYNVQGLGVARHAKNADAAQLLVDWVIRNVPLQIDDGTGKSVGNQGWLDEEVGLLAERAGYR